jgi:hypothetical protein
MRRLGFAILLALSALSCAHSQSEPPLQDCIDAAHAGGVPEKLSDDIVLCVLRSNKRGVTSCREKYTSAQPEITGTMQVMFVIEPNGKTIDQTTSPETFLSTELGKCLVEEVSRWTFPSFTGLKIPVDFSIRK